MLRWPEDCSQAERRTYQVVLVWSRENRRLVVLLLRGNCSEDPTLRASTGSPWVRDYPVAILEGPQSMGDHGSSRRRRDGHDCDHTEPVQYRRAARAAD